MYQAWDYLGGGFQGIFDPAENSEMETNHSVCKWQVPKKSQTLRQEGERGLFYLMRAAGNAFWERVAFELTTRALRPSAAATRREGNGWATTTPTPTLQVTSCDCEIEGGLLRNMRTVTWSTEQGEKVAGV